MSTFPIINLSKKNIVVLWASLSKTAPVSLKHSFIPLSTITILIDWQIFSVKRFKIDVKKRQTLRVLKWLTFIETNCNKLLFLWFTEEQDDEDNKSRIAVVYLDREMTFEMVSIWVNILLEFVYSMYFLILLLL